MFNDHQTSIMQHVTPSPRWRVCLMAAIGHGRTGHLTNGAILLSLTAVIGCGTRSGHGLESQQASVLTTRGNRSYIEERRPEKELPPQSVPHSVGGGAREAALTRQSFDGDFEGLHGDEIVAVEYFNPWAKAPGFRFAITRKDKVRRRFTPRGGSEVIVDTFEVERGRIAQLNALVEVLLAESVPEPEWDPCIPCGIIQLSIDVMGSRRDLRRVFFHRKPVAQIILDVERCLIQIGLGGMLLPDSP